MHENSDIPPARLERMLQYLDDQLPRHERAAFERELESDARLREEVKTLKGSMTLLRDAAPQFDPYFTTRVMAAVRETAAQETSLFASLWSAFRYASVAAALLIVLASAYNVSQAWENRYDSSPFELALSLPPVTLDTSLEYVEVTE